jgi:pyruvate,water dikinase
MRFLARQVVACTPMREAPKHHAMRAFERIRAAALELGRRLAQRGVLHEAGDVMFLEWPELQSLATGGEAPADLPGRVSERRATLDRRRAVRPPDLLRSDGVPEDEDETEEAPAPGTLRGLGVSGGHARGPVRILRRPDVQSLRDGDVLVVEYADPGWTPLFPRASALVMEVGGAMSHAAVVARELGIPAVFGVRKATTNLVDGGTVEVDGDRGLVRARS